MKIELKITIYLTTSYIPNSDSASPPNTGESPQRKLRAFLCLLTRPLKALTRSRLRSGERDDS